MWANRDIFLDMTILYFFNFGGTSLFKMSTALKEINVILEDTPFCHFTMVNTYLKSSVVDDNKEHTLLKIPGLKRTQRVCAALRLVPKVTRLFRQKFGNFCVCCLVS